MKALFTFLFLLGATLCNAQNWCPQSAEWIYSMGQGMYANGYQSINYINDTTINGLTCHKTNQSFTGTNWNSGGQIVTMHIASHYTYEQNKVVYYYNSTNNVFDTLCNFNAPIGSKWLNLLHPTPACQNGRRAVTVLDTSHKIINGVSLKKMALQYNYLAGGTNTVVITDTVYEKIGSTVNFLFPYKCETNFLVDPDYSSTAPFRCYKDNSFTSFQVLNSFTPNCYYITNTKELNRSNNLLFYPNPASNHITFKAESSQENIETISIINQLGEQISFFNLRDNEKIIDVSKFQSGIYFLRATTSTKKEIIQKLFIE